MTATLEQSFSALSTASGPTVTITVPATISVGQLLVLATDKNATSGNTGVASITGAGSNTWQLNVAGSCRASTHDLTLHILPVTSQIAAGTVLTITHNVAGNRKVVAAAVFSGLTNAIDQTSGNTGVGTPGNADYGYSGAGLNPSASTPDVTTPYCLVFGAVTPAGGATTTPGLDFEILEIQTAVGTADRGVETQYSIANASGPKSVTGTFDQTSGWAAAVLALPIAGSPPGDPVADGINLLLNSSFERDFGGLTEHDTPPANWEGNPVEARSRELVGDAVDGGYIGVLTNPDGRPAPNWQSEARAANNVIAEGDVVTGSIYFRKRSGSATFVARLDIQFFDATDTPITGAAIGPNETPSSSWQRTVITGTAPAGTTHAQVRITMQSAALGDAIEIDAAKLEKGSAATDYSLNPEDVFQGSVTVGGTKKTVTEYSVIVGGAKKSVTSISVIVGGVKKPLA